MYTLGALEKASDSVRRLKLGRLQMESENNRLDENLKAATIEITRRLRERDLLKRELRNSQFDASRDLQDAQTGKLFLSQTASIIHHIIYYRNGGCDRGDRGAII